MFKYGVISGPYFSVFSPNTGIYRPEITLYLDTFHTVNPILKECEIPNDLPMIGKKADTFDQHSLKMYR